MGTYVQTPFSFNFSPFTAFLVVKSQKSVAVSTRGRYMYHHLFTGQGRSTVNSNAATGGQLEGVGRSVASSGVNADNHPSKEATGDIVTEVDVVEDGVGGAVGGLLFAENVVLGVGGLLDGVGAIRRNSLDLGYKGLVPEQLANVRHGSAGQGSVLELGGVLVDDNVHVVGAAAVVAGEDGGELNNTIRIGLLDATQSRVVQVGRIVRVTVAAGLHTAVDTCRVAVALGVSVHLKKAMVQYSRVQ